MYTYQMIGLADENGKTYVSDYGTYSKKEGFKFSNDFGNEECKWTAFINMLFHEDMWKLKKDPIKKMTLDEIEKELGYKVQIVDPAPKRKLTKKEKKEIDDTIEWLDRVLGVTLKSDKYYK